MGWFWFSTKRLLQLGACVVCACSQWMVVTEVIRVTLPDLCAGSIIQKSYQQCKLHFPSRSDKELIGGGKLEWSSQAWPGISKRYTLIVWLLKSPFTWSYSQPPPNRPSRPSDLDKAISLCSVVNVKKTKCWIFISRSFIYRHAHQNWLQLDFHDEAWRMSSVMRVKRLSKVWSHGNQYYLSAGCRVNRLWVRWGSLSFCPVFFLFTSLKF